MYGPVNAPGTSPVQGPVLPCRALSTAGGSVGLWEEPWDGSVRWAVGCSPRWALGGRWALGERKWALGGLRCNTGRSVAEESRHLGDEMEEGS